MNISLYKARQIGLNERPREDKDKRRSHGCFSVVSITSFPFSRNLLDIKVTEIDKKEKIKKLGGRKKVNKKKNCA